ncbi:alpha-N-arabinofuranosidase [Pontibacter diazotrophicus]|uniref:Alpha-N-arabinofuranosidase n=1 Tax=Pontibacter diazotrophicus TaxID=1400979 RepID=A0A3D8L0W1_9BACT|nr:glycoside hydrolase family 43 protein [Pontibacter diazotrophicus]RDV11068.1 alpha-N-arabinofuranosidase [Pontibacter diazotrophicus]
MNKKSYFKKSLFVLLTTSVLASGCQNTNVEDDNAGAETPTAENTNQEFLNEPLVTDLYTADPSAHVFNGRIYIYPSHDIDAGIPDDDTGDQYAMRDYHVYSMDSVGGEVTDHGVALDIDDVPWAGKQMWAPDAAFKDGTYYLYFPVKDKNDVFRIGVATSDSPTGPFTPEPEPIANSFSMDPAVYMDDDGSAYMFFGGIWGGQLQRWSTGEYNPNDEYPADDQPALMPKVARMSPDMKSFSEEVRDVQLLDENGQPLLAGDNERRFFEAAWMHKYNGKYYFSYSTGDTHNIAYAVGDSPYGPFTYQGVLLNPVQGWTNHHSIVEKDGQWYVFYHDTQISGKNHLRNIKVAELNHRPDGTIETITAYNETASN